MNQFAAVGALIEESARTATGGLPPPEFLELREPTPATLDERRVVTVLFCDVSNSTAMASQLDPEDWADIMAEAFNYLIQPVERYGGTVARLMGDSILAFFGAPRSHEDDPQRAILAALDILNGIQPLRERVSDAYGLDFNVRIGINTGTVVVGEFGSERASEYTAMGDTINLAARLEQIAPPGAIQVAETTYRMTAPFFQFEALGKLDIRSKYDAVPVYRVVGARSKPGRLWDVLGLHPPLAGREAEMAVLRAALTDLSQGCGQLISLIGEAGLGKTRLIEELHNLWERRATELGDAPAQPTISWLENRLIAHEELQPYGALQQRLRQAFDLDIHDPPDAMRAKILRRLSHFPQEVSDRATWMIDLVLSADGSGEGSEAGFDSADVTSELFELMLVVLRGWTNGGALIYVVEDTHLIDPASAELLIHVMQLVEEIPILFICSFRPEQPSAAWQIRDAVQAAYPDYYRELRLQSLTDGESAELVDSLVVPHDESTELRELILRKAEGNPLFVEELVRALIERGVLVRSSIDHSPRWELTPDARLDELEVPDTIQSLLQERIDRLAPDARRILQQASMLGRTFSWRVLAEISEANGDLEDYLQQLLQADLLTVTTNGDDRGYAFRHALVWEVVYGTTLRRQRRLVHQRAREAIELIDPKWLEDHTSDFPSA